MAFIEIRNVSKSFQTPAGTRHVLRDISLDVDRGEFVSIVGAMGSGKSTLLSILAGLTNPDEGHVTIGGAPQRGIRSDSAFVFQNYSLLPWFTALENVRLAVDAAFPSLPRDEQRALARATLERVGLGNALHRRPRQLSGGMRQRVALARALATRPQILFLDDPFGALDALTRETLQQDLARLGSGQGGSEDPPLQPLRSGSEDPPLRPPGSGSEHPPLRSAGTPAKPPERPAVSHGGPSVHPTADRSGGPSGPRAATTTIMITNSVEEALLLSDRIIPILAGPPATLGTPIVVELPRPRSLSQLAHDELATRARAHVVGALTESIRVTRGRRERARAAAADAGTARTLASDATVVVAEESR